MQNKSALTLTNVLDTRHLISSIELHKVLVEQLGFDSPLFLPQKENIQSAPG